jgi:hypothetical protein
MEGIINKRVRVLSEEFLITKPLEQYRFEIKLPHNVHKVVAIDYDVRMRDGLIIEDEVVLNPSLGRIKLQAMRTSHVFYSAWVNALDYLQSITFYSAYPFKIDTWLYYNEARLVEVPNNTKIIKGLFEDRLIKAVNKDFAYWIKILVWYETQEAANGIQFGFLKIQD